MKTLIKNLILILFILVNTYTSKAQNKTDESKLVLLVDAEKTYYVTLTIDKLIKKDLFKSIDKGENISNDNTLTQNLLNKIHCEFNVFYFWKNNFIMRAVVNPLDSVEIREYEKYKEKDVFSLDNFNNNDTINLCRCNNWIGTPLSDFLSPIPIYSNSNFQGAIIKIKYKDKIMYFKLFTIEIAKCNPGIKDNKCPNIYSMDNGSTLSNFCLNYYNDTSKIGKIKNYIFKSIFEQKQVMLFPESLPIKYNDYIKSVKVKTYDSCCIGIGNLKENKIKIKKASNISNTSIYKIQNKIIYHDDVCKQQKKEELIYIPHLLYLPITNFPIKIKTINGEPFEQFMTHYTDNFRPTLMPPKAVNNEETIGEKEETFIVVEEDASFDGGNINTFYQWVKQNVIYPKEDVDNFSERRLFIQFAVNSKGEVCDLKVVRSSGDSLLDNEAIRVIKTSPKWKPARQYGANVKQGFTMPVIFKLPK